MTLEIPDYEAFAPLVDSVFIAAREDGEGGVALTLIEAQALDAAGRPAEWRVPFQLIFRMPGDTVSAQGNYRLHHPALGDILLFMVPCAQSADGVDYAVTVN